MKKELFLLFTLSPAILSMLVTVDYLLKGYMLGVLFMVVSIPIMIIMALFMYFLYVKGLIK